MATTRLVCSDQTLERVAHKKNRPVFLLVHLVLLEEECISEGFFIIFVYLGGVGVAGEVEPVKA